MTPRFVLLVLVLSGALAACGGSAPQESSESVPTATGATATPAPERGVATGRVGAGQGLRSLDGRLEAASPGGEALTVTIREMGKDAPAAPGGWELVTPVYDITARDAAGKAVTQMKQPLDLRFTSSEVRVTVAHWDGDSWEIAASEAASGVVSARVEHLSRYGVIRPAIKTAKVSPTASPSMSATPPAIASVDAAKAALEAAIRKFGGRSTTLRSGEPIAGATATGLPPAIAAALSEAGVFGTVFEAPYGGVNLGFVSNATAGTANGSYALLVEPKVGFPGSSREAQLLLVEYFPGAAGLQYAPVQEGPGAYTYQASSGSGFVVLGFVQHEGLPLAFMSTGSGLYVQPAVSVKAVQAGR